MRRYLLPFIAVCISLIVLASPVSAVSVSITPEQINEGDTITIAISGLADGSVFALRMESAIELHDSATFTYQANQVTVPFGMNSPRVTLLASPVTEAGVEASDGDSVKSMKQLTKTGSVSIIQTLGTIPAGTIEMLKAFGNPTSDAEYVDITLELSGTKTGPDSGSITFGLSGIKDGSARIIVLVDGSEAMNKKVTIGNPTITPTPTATSPPSSNGGSNGGSTTPTPTDSVSVSSLDGKVRLSTVATSITGASADDIRIIQSEPRNLPDDWVVLGPAYVISPATSLFTPAARLSFPINESYGAPFLASYAGNTWSIIPARVEGSYLVAEISGAGQYAMMVFSSDEPVATPQVPPQTTVSQTTAVPVTTTEIPQTTQSSGGWPGLIGAVSVGILLLISSRRF